MKKKKAKVEAIVHAWAEKNEVEIDGLLQEGEGRFRLTGTQLYPVPVGDHVIYSSLPVTAELQLDRVGRVASVNVRPDETALSAARAFLLQLMEQNKLAGLSGQDVPGATHALENKSGKWVLKRRRFY